MKILIYCNRLQKNRDQITSSDLGEPISRSADKITIYVFLIN